jgi:Spy/CpxP family protein refolding chaperone
MNRRENMLKAKMPIAAALACVLATIAPGALAEPFGDHPLAAERLEKGLARMAERLDLTDAQQEEIRAILDAHHAAVDLERARLREQMDAVLTDEQRALRDERMQGRMERRLEGLADRLDLTDEQREQMQAIMAQKRTDPGLTRTEVRERMAAVLTDEQRKRLAQKGDQHRGRPERW